LAGLKLQLLLISTTEMTKQKGQKPFPTAGFTLAVYLLILKKKDSELLLTDTIQAILDLPRLVKRIFTYLLIKLRINILLRIRR
jgi:hypothetical protein